MIFGFAIYRTMVYSEPRLCMTTVCYSMRVKTECFCVDAVCEFLIRLVEPCAAKLQLMKLCIFLLDMRPLLMAAYTIAEKMKVIIALWNQLCAQWEKLEF